MSEWSVEEPRRLTFDTAVTALHVRIVNGTVNVVGTEEETSRLQVSEVHGPPLRISEEGGTLTVAYDDLSWHGLLGRLDPLARRHRSAVVSLCVPTGTRVEVGVVGAGAMVSGIENRTEVRGVSGDITLVGLSGPVSADTVSGGVEAQGLSGDFRFKSVFGDLTVVDGSGTSVRADSVSGSMIVDLTADATDESCGATVVSLTSVSGEIAIRLPHPANTEVEANTTGGSVSNAFEDLRVSGQWGTKKITGRLGSGKGTLKATTVSGSIALLRRPPEEHTGPGRVPLPDPEDGQGGGPGDAPRDAPVQPGDSPRGPESARADVPTDEKVL